MFMRLVWLAIFSLSAAFATDSETFKKAEKFYAEKKYSIAQDLFVQAIKENALDERPYFYLANLQTLGSNYAEAEKNYQKAIELKSDDADYLLNFGSLRFLQKNLGESEALYLKALGLRPNFPEVYTRLAKQYFDVYEWEKSAEALEKLLVLVPDHPDRKTIEIFISKLHAGKTVAEAKRAEIAAAAKALADKKDEKVPGPPVFSVDVKANVKTTELDTKSESSIKQKTSDTDIVE
jgi:tetratricopeptide (TPR) repeat protein